MITVKEAEKIILNHQYQPGTEYIPLTSSEGRILREEMVADRPFPPFDRVSMDGIAIQYQAFESGQRTFEIVGLSAAGTSQGNLIDPTKCFEVMTGAIAPFGTDTVIKYEDLHVENGKATIQPDHISEKQNVHQEGSDRSKGEVIVSKGIQITPAEIGVAASVGMHQLLVSTLPRVVIISTGDELIDVHESPLPHQIRKSNEYQISSALARHGINADRMYVKDEKSTVSRKITECLRDYDVMILSGGVSAGKFDFIPKALEQNGVQKHFHRVAQRPGKPLWFGTSSSPLCTVFALPGNPVSSFMCTTRYIIPWLRKSLDQTAPSSYAVLKEDYTFKPDLTYYLQVRTEVNSEGVICAYPETGGGSGDLANLVLADSFLELPQGRETFPAGESFPFYRFRYGM